MTLMRNQSPRNVNIRTLEAKPPSNVPTETGVAKCVSCSILAFRWKAAEGLQRESSGLLSRKLGGCAGTEDTLAETKGMIKRSLLYDLEMVIFTPFLTAPQSSLHTSAIAYIKTRCHKNTHIKFPFLGREPSIKNKLFCSYLAMNNFLSSWIQQGPGLYDPAFGQRGMVAHFPELCTMHTWIWSCAISLPHWGPSPNTWTLGRHI